MKNKIFFLLIVILFVTSCNEKTIYSGKIINQENLTNLNISNKNELIDKFGHPSYIDPIENKLFYFTEKSKKKNFFNKNIEYSYLFVFNLDKNENIISQNVYNLLDKNEIKLAKIETENNIHKRGLIEKIFGGIGHQQLPDYTP